MMQKQTNEARLLVKKLLLPMRLKKFIIWTHIYVIHCQKSILQNCIQISEEVFSPGTGVNGTWFIKMIIDSKSNR